MDEQQVEEFLSEEESSNAEATLSASSPSPDNFIGETQQHRSHQQQEAAANSNRRHKTTVTAKPGQHFVRFSALSSSSRRRSSARRRRSGRQNRQVRFQPNPQSIDISSSSIKLEQPDQNGAFPAKSQQTVTVKRLRRAVHLPSAKPIARRLHHLSHLKFADKIKLKSFNQLAQQLHQSLSSASSSSNQAATCDALQSGTKGAAVQVRLVQQVGASPSSMADQQVAGPDEDLGWGSDFDEQSQGSSLDSRIASKADQHDYLLEIGKASSDLRALDDVIHDRGISGQFKRLDTIEQVAPASGSNSNPIGHKVRIELERRMIRDSLLAEAPAGPQSHTQQVTTDSGEQADSLPEVEETDDDDEAELRSLEARQGFRQIRDKLQVILDQRLANYAEQEAQPATKDARTASRQPEKVSASPEAAISPAQSDSSVPQTTKELAGKAQVHQSEFDCQSHCSDESGLESNHSGSQDSGHSTQHSGYSAHCALHRRHAPSVETEPGSEEGASGGRSPTVSISPACGSQKAASPERPPSDGSKSDEGVADMERRSRFLQNRLIINSKLESMFKSRAPAKTSSTSSPIARSQTVASLAPNIAARLEAGSSLNQLLVDPETRNRLLEQQRQMSLKLKQKPRRKSARRALMNVDSGSLSEQPIQQVVAPPQPPPLPPSSLLLLPNRQQIQPDQTDNGSYTDLSQQARRNKHDSLTKQLSMICLRQACQQQLVMHNQQQAAAKLTQNLHQATHRRSPLGGGPRAALSLRQLVKDVIDDCERPSKLSPLTMSILNRSSDSLTSELANEDRPPTSSPSLQQVSSGTCGGPFSSVSSSLSSLPAHPVADVRQQQQQQQQQHRSYDHLSNCQETVEESRQDEESRQPIGYIYPVPLANPLQYQQQVVDQSLSSMGSIEGLEFSLGKEDSNDVQVSSESNPTAQRFHKSTIGSYLKSLREFSKFKLPKVKLISGSGSSSASSDVLHHDGQLQCSSESRTGESAIHRSRLPFDSVQQKRLLSGSGDGCNNYNYEYHLDRVVRRQQNHHHHHQQSQKPEGSSTLAGAWRRRPKRTSIMDADSHRAIAMMSSSPTTSSSKGDGFANHFVTISNRKWKSCHLRTSLMQMAAFKSHYQEQQEQEQQPKRLSGDHGNRRQTVAGSNHSPVHSGGKHQLAYLDNSKNFTDDDN